MLRVVGVNHRTAPVDVREKLVFHDAEVPDALEALGSGIILSTCNRTEIYQETEAGARASITFLAGRFNDSERALMPHLYQLSDLDAVRHLFAVAAGLDSMILGEPQILGQVRLAAEMAEATVATGSVLSRVFRDAIRVGKRARTETFVGRHAVSVSYAAVELARTVLGTLHGRKVLVVGAGQMGELAVRTLVDHGVDTVVVANRTVANAAALANQFGGSAVPLQQVVEALEGADIVISSTDASSYVISRSDVEQVMVRRDQRPLLLIDIAVPRDIDPSVRGVTGIHLHDIDDLQTLCEMNREARRREARRVQRIIDDETARFERWWRVQDVIPTIVAVREQAERARQEELREAYQKLRQLSEEDRATIDALTRAIVAKVLHGPTVRLKGLAAAEQSEAINSLARDLFGLA